MFLKNRNTLCFCCVCFFIVCFSWLNTADARPQATHVAHASFGRGKLVVDPIGPYWKEHIKSWKRLTESEVYENAALQWFQWMLDKGAFYSQKPKPLAPISEGIDCTRFGFLAWKWAGKFVHRITAARIERGEGGWTNIGVTFDNRSELDLGFTQNGKHMVIGWRLNYGGNSKDDTWEVEE